jgi:hypothetical protein
MEPLSLVYEVGKVGKVSLVVDEPQPLPKRAGQVPAAAAAAAVVACCGRTNIGGLVACSMRYDARQSPWAWGRDIFFFPFTTYCVCCVVCLVALLGFLPFPLARTLRIETRMRNDDDDVCWALLPRFLFS